MKKHKHIFIERGRGDAPGILFDIYLDKYWDLCFRSINLKIEHQSLARLRPQLYIFRSVCENLGECDL